MKYTENQIITAMKGTGGIISQIINNLSKLDSNTTISRQGLYERIEKNDTLKEAYQAEQERIGDIVETGFFKALQGEKEWAMKEWFRYKGYTRGYVPKQQTDLTSGDKPLPLLGVIKVDSDNSTPEDSEPQAAD